MNRKSFALSWGRKVFFGLGWPLLSLVALSYFQSHIIPNSALGLLYWWVTLIGHYGVITGLLYYLCYYPLAVLFPYYYFARFWSILLLMTTALLIYLDSVVFALYRFHFNNFVLNLLLDGAGKEIFNFSPGLMIVIATLFLAATIYLWFSGERIWRNMQRRFSNPNSNWYLLAILACVVLSHGLHIYGDAFGNRKITRHAGTFPLYFPATAKGLLGKADILPPRPNIQDGVPRDFNYPLVPVACPGKENKNILFITVKGWGGEELSEETTPLLNHYTSHGIKFEGHRSGSSSERGGLFSLFYSLPENYWNETLHDQVSPVFLDELQNRGYSMSVISESPMEALDLDRTVFLKVPSIKVSNNVNEDWRTWLETYLSSGTAAPFFGLIALASSQDVDRRVSEIVEGLYAKGLLEETLVLITGSNGGLLASAFQVPLLILWPGMDPQAFNHPTSHYDVVPTIMNREWACASPAKHYSDGESLFNSSSADWIVIGGQYSFKIVDYKKRHILTVDPKFGYEVTDFALNSVPRKNARLELILSVLKNEARFRKKN